MKKILIALAVVSFIACGSRKSEVQKQNTETKTENKTEIVENRDVQTVSDNKTVEIIPTDTTHTATVSIKDTVLPDGTKLRVYKLNKARIVVSDTKTLQVDKTAVKTTQNVKAIKRENIKHKHTQREAWPYWWLFWLIILILLYLFARFVVLKNYL